MNPLAEKYYACSPYVYCMNNPLKYTDPDGREKLFKIRAIQPTPYIGPRDGIEKQKYTDNNMIHIYSHGIPSELQIQNDDGTNIRIRSSNDLKAFLDQNSSLWNKKGGKDVIIVLHSCQVGNPGAFAELMSKADEFQNITFIAPFGRIIINPFTGDELVASHGSTTWPTSKDYIFPWQVYRNGKLIKEIDGDIRLDDEKNAQEHVPGYTTTWQDAMNWIQYAKSINPNIIVNYGN